MVVVILFVFIFFLIFVFFWFFWKWGWGQVICILEFVYNLSYEVKCGILIMGGVIFIVGLIVGYFIGVFVSGQVLVFLVIFVIWFMVGFGVVGFIDDYMKVCSQCSFGLFGWCKIIGQLIVVILFGIVVLNFLNKWGQMFVSVLILLFWDIIWFNFFVFGVIFGWILYLVWILIIGVVMLNSVNFIDGLDGFVVGVGVFVVGVYSFIVFWQFKQLCIGGDIDVIGGCYEVCDLFNFVIIVVFFVVSFIGFLWWNVFKVKVFMGDVGLMVIGGVIMVMVIFICIEFLFFVIVGVFVLFFGFVILQCVYFKIICGKCLFLMSLFYYYFEMCGWFEVMIVVCMWIIVGFFVVFVVGFFYVEWLICVG